MKIETTARNADGLSPRSRARIAGGLYLIVYITGTLSLFTGSVAAGLIAGLCYILVTLFFYFIFKPVGRNISMLAASISLVGCILGVLGSVKPVFLSLNPLVFFGVYCLLIGYLVFKSTFLPRLLGVLMAIGGLGWLTFAIPQLANSLSPYNFAPGMIGEGVLTIWLLVMGVNNERWNQLVEDNERQKAI